MKLHLNKKFVLLILLLSISTVYSQPKHFSMDELIKTSQFIVKVKITNINSYFGANNNIFSDINFIVLSVFKGNIKIGEQFKITYMGGKVGNRSTLVLELPVFNDKNESFLFLNKTPNGNYYITGLTQGKFDTNKDEKGKYRVFRDQHASSPITIYTSLGNQIIDNYSSILQSDFQKQLENIIKSER